MKPAISTQLSAFSRGNLLWLFDVPRLGCSHSCSKPEWWKPTPLGVGALALANAINVAKKLLGFSPGKKVLHLFFVCAVPCRKPRLAVGVDGFVLPVAFCLWPVASTDSRSFAFIRGPMVFDLRASRGNLSRLAVDLRQFWLWLRYAVSSCLRGDFCLSEVTP